MEISSGVRTLTLAETFTIARGSTDSEEVVWAEIRHGGHVGRGEGAPDDRYGETVEACRAFIDGAGDALGDDPFALEAIETRLRARGGSVAAARGRVRAPRPGRQARRAADLAPARARGRARRRRRTRSASTRSRARRTARAAQPRPATGGSRSRSAARATSSGCTRSARVCDLPLRVDANEGWDLEAARRAHARRSSSWASSSSSSRSRPATSTSFRALRDARRAASRSSSTRAATPCATSPTSPPTPTASTSSSPRAAASARRCAWCTRRARSASSSCSAA